MNKETKKFSFKFKNKELIFEIDKFALKSNKSIICRFGNTTVLTVLTIKEHVVHELSFFPLTVSVEEKAYATCRIPPFSNKRESRNSDIAIKYSRMIDRSLRPFFLIKNVDKEIKVNNIVLSVGEENPFLVSAWNSFLVCYLSEDLPFFDVLFSTVLMERVDLELVVSLTEDKKIVMIDSLSNEIPEKDWENIFFSAQEDSKNLIVFFKKIASDFPLKKEKKMFVTDVLETKEEPEVFLIPFQKKIMDILHSPSFWHEKEKKISNYLDLEVKRLKEKNQDYLWKKKKMEATKDDILKEYAKKKWDNGERVDGRKKNEIREFSCETDILSLVHGSASFTRGLTQVISITTLGKESDRQIVDSYLSQNFLKKKYFFHHYNFPDFSVNKISSFSSCSRREIGHGDLVEKTIKWLLPNFELFPHSIRVVSEVLSSDGSSSQASICSTVLSLSAAGVPLNSLAAGVALGIFEGQIITDINAFEDKISSADLKIAGTKKGVLSLQLDVKDPFCFSFDVFKACLEEAREARTKIIEKMEEEVSKITKKEDKTKINWRKVYVGSDNVKHIIGPGGKTINYLIQLFKGASIEVQQDGFLLVYHNSVKQIEELCQKISEIVERY